MEGEKEEETAPEENCQAWKSFKHTFLDNSIIGGNPLVQQTMPGWFSYIAVKWICPLYVFFVVLFISLGIAMIVKSTRYTSVSFDYESINRYQYLPDDPAVNINEGLRSFTVDGVTHSQGTGTWLTFVIEKKLSAPISFYYTLGRVYQNYRTFNEGRLVSQLRGDARKRWPSNPRSCKPFVSPGFLDGDDEIPISRTVDGSPVTSASGAFRYNPCGSMPWAMFNDTFTLYKVSDSGDLRIICNASDFDAVGNPLGNTNENHCKKRDISWKANTEVRFKKLVTGSDIWSRDYPYETDNEYLKNGWYLNEPGHQLPDPLDYDFQVWMTSAVLSRFRKLHRTITTDLHPGTYSMYIEEFYDVTTFDGQKGFLLENAGPLGDGTKLLGIMCLILGFVSFVMGVAFCIEMSLSSKSMPFPNMKEPKRSWYVFDPMSREFQVYNDMRILKYVPVDDLQALRERQTVT